MPDIIPTPADPLTAETPAFIRANPKAHLAFSHGWNRVACFSPFDPALAWRSGIEAALRQIKADENKANR